MLIQVGFRPNNLFISNSAKHYTLSSPSYLQLTHHQYHNGHHSHHHHNHHNHHHHHSTNSHPNSKHDLKHFQAFLNCRKKKMKRSVMVSSSCQESSDGGRSTGVGVGGGGGGVGNGGTDGKIPIAKCLDTIENDLARLGKHQSLNPFKNLKIRKEGGVTKGKASRAAENGDGSAPPPPSSTRLAVEFPMILNVGSIYSSHVVLYLDP